MTRTKKPPKSCYACNKRKVSLEHVPPQCFFPKGVYLKSGQDLRKNLITVPSCDEHNIEKSKDDLYLLYTILVFYKNNTVAQNYFSKKVLSALKKAPHLVSLFGPMQPVVVNGELTASYTINKERLDRALESVARALYFHHYQEKWTFPIDVFCPDSLVLNPEQMQSINAESQALGLKLEEGSSKRASFWRESRGVSLSGPARPTTRYFYLENGLLWRSCRIWGGFNRTSPGFL